MEAAAVVVLVVEDEQMIRMLVEDTLSEGGFKVDVAQSAEQAIRLLDVPDAAYRALLTDVNLGPGRPTGWEVARHARKLFPTMPVIYMTGDSGAEWSSRGVPGSVLLMKPFAPAQLVTAVSQLLNAHPPSADNVGTPIFPEGKT